MLLKLEKLESIRIETGLSDVNSEKDTIDAFKGLVETINKSAEVIISKRCDISVHGDHSGWHHHIYVSFSGIEENLVKEIINKITEIVHKFVDEFRIMYTISFYGTGNQFEILS